MNEIYSQMLSAYDLTTEQQKRNATFEVNQQVVLAGLYHAGFFDAAAFYGGTCLRIFYGLQRLSSADINQVKTDVLPFVRNPKELDIWSNDYFLQLANMIKIE
jgi:predicted nucleotidyltransferase component of viral defense system